MKLILMLSLLFSLFASPAPNSLQSGSPLWFVFLTNGSGPRPDDPDELMKMQAAHIDNFMRRFEEGKLLAAGPLNDPTRFLRGIVILRVPDKAAVLACFEGDPYLENKIMDVDAFRWDADAEWINLDLPDPNSIEENRLLLIRQANPGQLDPGRLDAHRAYAAKAYPPGIHGESQDGDFRRVFLFPGAEETSIRAAMAGDPLAGVNEIEFQLMPLWLAKDVLRKGGQSTVAPF
jgi:uncharacterized protein YciI